MKPLKSQIGCTPRTTTKQIGDAAEGSALRHLQQQGMHLLQANYRTPGRGGGEIDLVMRARDGTLVFVEVRMRRQNRQGGALASVTLTKQRRIILAAHHYLRRYQRPPPCRFDVVGVGPEGVCWVQAAFDTGA